MLWFDERLQTFRGSFPLVLLSLLLGFVLANVFGTVLNLFRNKIAWDGFALFGIVGLIEVTSFLTYSPSVCAIRLKRLAFLQLSGNPVFSWRVVNSFKIGLLLGFFVDAFKVGS